MQQTANYQLNQWDGEDRIMRVDFNSDNAKIDAALEKNATALSQATSTLEAALETERQARLPVIPPPIRQPLPPGRNCSTPLLPSNPPALPAMPLSAENLPLRTHPSGRILPQPTQQYHPPVPS